MIKEYTPIQIKEILKNATIRVDSREKGNSNIISYFEKQGINYEIRKLDIADYTILANGYSFADEVVIEYKGGGLDELAGNFTHDRQRFEDEMTLAKARGVKMFLLIEDASWEKIACHSYRSKMEPKALMASLLSWQVRYGLTVMMCQPEMSGQLIWASLYYHAKERLERG